MRWERLEDERGERGRRERGGEEMEGLGERSG